MPIEFPVGGSAGGGFPVTPVFISNNTTGSILTLDKSTIVSSSFHYNVYRKSDTNPEAVRSGFLIATHRTDTDVWVLSDILDAFDDLDTVGITFSINPATGVISYTSSNYNTSGYASSLRIQPLSELTL